MAALGALVAGSAHHPARASALDESLAFAAPARCEPGPVLAKLLAAMVAGDANAGFRAGRVEVPPAHAGAFGPIYLQQHDGYTVIGVPVRGSLFGLPLVAIEQSLPEGGDSGQTHYRFKSDPKEAERVLAARGFPVKLGESVPIGPPDGQVHFIELLADPHHRGHALLTCGYQ